MSQEFLILKQTICSQYQVDTSFVDELDRMGLIQIEVIEQEHFVHHDQIGELERIIRLHRDLNVNLEGIDIVLNLLEKQQELLDELTSIKNRLRLYETE